MTPRIGIGLAALAFGLTAAQAALAAELALDRVMLSTGGVGYFEYEAKVDGNSTLTLDVPLDQVDDVLKSLVVFDDKGGVGGVELPGLEPSAQLFRDLPFGPEALESPVALLNALQGSEVVATGARTLTGRLLKVEPETQVLPGEAGTITRHRLTLMTGEGLQQLVLEDAQAVKFADPALQAQVDKALTILAASHARDRRSLTITSRGTGERTVRVAYVVGAPLWKTSYRLSLPADPDAAKARLQGWAVIENMSGQDWKDVELTLVSGSPVTFRQALYASYYVDRQEVPVEVVGRILPNLDTGASTYIAAEAAMDDSRDRSRAYAGGAVGAAPPLPAPAPALAAAPITADYEAAKLAGGSADVASTEAQTQVVFKLAQPVSVASGRSLSVPIIDRDVPAARLALYQPGVHQRHPLASIELRNDGETGLPPGILTLYEQGPGGVGYTGDARLPVLPTGEERMISYALDQKVRLDRAETSESTLRSGTIERGVFRFSTLDQRIQTYKISAPAREGRNLILELPKLEGYSLVEPKSGIEETERYWRVPVKLAAGKTVEIKVVAQRVLANTLSVGSLGDGQIAYYGSAQAVDAKTREAFTRIASLKREQADLAQAAANLARKLDELGQEQGRLRANLDSVPRDSDLYRRYLKKLDEQETAIEDLQEKIADARDKADTAARKLADFIAAL
ncbi:DUF4139 domain-containing protein [Zavarzinia compransoris]|uniref:DUF4139 domain-containing protein n=1 Tax=Zavarzinia compransoris TaxID=1264899 RepID=A0A317DYM4_9PROT|nr:DUF4139 domain-containing protein [Zavarzinia compransoris]PWR19040.1 hypothetical protein DKG75_18935 [Zavarzinia compransoris]TDP49047.1 uncharacterized protein DUF4139 [Zavarzinia compransoris]